MLILVCNVGSTSLKYQLLDMDGAETVLAGGRFERVGAPMGRFVSHDVAGEVAEDVPVPDYAAAIRRMLAALAASGALPDPAALSCIAFKVVHGGPVTGTRLLDEEALAALTRFSAAAPGHNPPYLAAIRQFAALLPDVPRIGAFETAFHATLPPKAYLYSVPKTLREWFGLRRYGFHGASHEYVSGKVMAYMGGACKRLITCHLGGSGSLSAIENGRSVDTNLGFSLQSGVFHNNRCGDLDPYIPIYLMEEQGYSLADVETLLGKQCGMLGMSGVSNDLRDVEAAAASGDADAKNAVDAYCYAIKKQIGAYAAALGGLDAIAFSGGIGENSASVRRMSLEALDFLGISLDQEKNDACVPDCEISDGREHVKIFVIATNEELTVARKARAFLESAAAE